MHPKIGQKPSDAAPIDETIMAQRIAETVAMQGHLKTLFDEAMSILPHSSSSAETRKSLSEAAMAWADLARLEMELRATPTLKAKSSSDFKHKG